MNIFHRIRNGFTRNVFRCFFIAKHRTEQTGNFVLCDFRKAFEPVKCPFLIVSFSSDWLFPEYHSRGLSRILLENGNDVTFCNIQSGYGHDAFLLEYETLGKLMTGFLTNLAQEVCP